MPIDQDASSHTGQDRRDDRREVGAEKSSHY